VQRVASAGRRRTDLVFVGVGVGILLALWIIGGKQGWGKGMVVTPAEAVRPITNPDSQPVYRRAVAATVWAAFRGLVIGSSVAFVAALVGASVPALRRTITRLATIANATPWVAVAPVMIVILGRGRGPVALAAIGSLFVVFVSASIGLGSASPAVHDVMSALGGGPLRRLRLIQLPACWPSVIDGLKLAAPTSLAAAIFGEWYGAPRGLGVLLVTAMQGGRADRLWAASLLAAACGLVAFAVLAAAGRLAARRYGGGVTQAVEAHAPRRRSWSAQLGVDVVAVTLLCVLLVLAWWTWIEVANVSPLVVPRPGAVWDDLSSAPGDYWSALTATLITAFIALVIGSVAGVGAALIASRSRVLSGTVVPVVVLLAATPLVALFPLFARVFGYQPNTVRFIAAVMVFYPMFVYARSGLSAASPAALDVVDSLGGSPGRRFRLVVVPEAVPHLASGFRIAAGSAVVAAVVAESLIGRHGLGVDFTYAYSLLDLPRAFGVALVVVAVSVAVFALASRVERGVHARWS